MSVLERTRAAEDRNRRKQPAPVKVMTTVLCKTNDSELSSSLSEISKGLTKFHQILAQEKCKISLSVMKFRQIFTLEVGKVSKNKTNLQQKAREISFGQSGISALGSVMAALILAYRYLPDIIPYIIPYLPVYKSTFYNLKICPKNGPRLIYGSKTKIKKRSGQLSTIIVLYGNKHPLLHGTSYDILTLIELSSSS